MLNREKHHPYKNMEEAIVIFEKMDKKNIYLK